ncbi:MAG: hypothetical protein HY718_01510 [Planctomycetes bacterium]|nr:hypothetical protein [Planctomycetota bacterium]
MRRSTVAVAWVLVAGLAGRVEAAPCFTVTGVSPTIVGRTLNPATTYHRIGGNVADGDVVVIDTTGANRSYEFDTNFSVTAGNVAIPLVALDNVAATRALAAAVNADPLAPCFAQAVPISATEQYVGDAGRDDYSVPATVPLPHQRQPHQ